MNWFLQVGDEVNEDTWLWVVEQEFDETGAPLAGIIHLGCIFQAAHLLGVCGETFIPKALTGDNFLDFFNSFYVNKYVDHQAFEIVF